MLDNVAIQELIMCILKVKEVKVKCSRLWTYLITLRSSKDGFLFLGELGSVKTPPSDN